MKSILMNVPASPVNMMETAPMESISIFVNAQLHSSEKTAKTELICALNSTSLASMVSLHKKLLRAPQNSRLYWALFSFLTSEKNYSLSFNFKGHYNADSVR